MKITKDDDGYAIVDFEGLEVNCFGFSGDMIHQLFNKNTVSQINNGVFLFQPLPNITNPSYDISGDNDTNEP